MGRPLRAVEGLPVVPVGAVLAAIPVVTVALVLDIALPLTIRAARAVAGVAAVAVIVTVTIAVAAVILARRVVSSTTSGARAAATRRRAARSAVAIGAVKSPRSRRGCAGPLNLQDIVTTDALVVHIMIGVIGITAVLVLDKSKQPAASAARGGNVAANKPAVSVGNVSISVSCKGLDKNTAREGAIQLGMPTALGTNSPDGN